MNKKRYFLESPEVKDYLIKGERFTKWSEVSGSLKRIKGDKVKYKDIKFEHTLFGKQRCFFLLNLSLLFGFIKANTGLALLCMNYSEASTE